MRCSAAIVAFTACLAPPLQAENVTATTTGTIARTTYSTFLSRSAATTATETATLTTNTHTETATTTTTGTETATATTTHTSTEAETSTRTTYSTFLSRSTATTAMDTATLTTNTRTEAATTAATGTETAAATTTHTITEAETSTRTTTLAEAATIAGSINMNVSNTSAFVADPRVNAALIASVAATAGVGEEYVTITVGQGGADQVVALDYTIALPPAEPARTLAESRRIKAAFGTTQDEVDQKVSVLAATITKRVDDVAGSGLYTVDVTGMSVPEVRIDAVGATTGAPPADEEEEESKSRPIIIAVIALAVALVGAIVVALACCCRRRR